MWHTSVLAWLRWSPESQHAGLRAAGARAARAPRRCTWRSRRTSSCTATASTRSSPRSACEHVFSVAPPSEWPKIYDGLDRERVGLSRVLTGYLDEDTVGRIDGILAEGSERTIDIGYRTVPGKPYLGRHAALKAEIAEAVREQADARGLRVDISTRAEDTFFGDDWYRFLASADTRSASRAAPACSTATARCARASTAASRRTLMRRSKSSRRHASRAATASFRCSPSRPGTSRRARPAPPRSSSRASTTACCAPVSTTSSCAAICRTSTRCSTSSPTSASGPSADRRPARTPTWSRPGASPTGGWSTTWSASCRPPPRSGGAAPGRCPSHAVDAASRPLVPLATRALMPARRRLLGALGIGHVSATGHPRPRRPARRRHARALPPPDRSDVPGRLDGASSTPRRSGDTRGSASVELNTHAGFPPGLRDVSFDAVILHYSLFGMTRITSTATSASTCGHATRTRSRSSRTSTSDASGASPSSTTTGSTACTRAWSRDQFDAVYGRYTSCRPCGTR